jgi:hypothetical protein
MTGGFFKDTASGVIVLPEAAPLVSFFSLDLIFIEVDNVTIRLV